MIGIHCMYNKSFLFFFKKQNTTNTFHIWDFLNGRLKFNKYFTIYNNNDEFFTMKSNYHVQKGIGSLTQKVSFTVSMNKQIHMKIVMEVAFVKETSIHIVISYRQKCIYFHILNMGAAFILFKDGNWNLDFSHSSNWAHLGNSHKFKFPKTILYIE